MNKLGLQLLEPHLGLLALGEVAYEAGEKLLIAPCRLADTKLERKRRAVLTFADDNPADADNPALSGDVVAPQIAVMTFPIGRRHQHLDVFA